MWRRANGHITARPTREYQRVVAVGFKRRADGRVSLSLPKVRKATKADHARLPAYRPRSMNRSRRPEKKTAAERSEEGGWEPNSSEADREQGEGSSSAEDGEGEGDVGQEPDEDKGGDAEEEDEDDEEEEEEEEEHQQEVREEVRQLNLRGRRVRIRRMVTSPVTPEPTHRKSPRTTQRKVIKRVDHREENDEVQKQEEQPRIEQIAKRLRLSLDNPGSASRSGSDLLAREAPPPPPTRSAPLPPTPPPVTPVGPTASPLLKALVTASAARGKALSFAVKASCSYGWLTRRRYVYVAYGLRFGSFKKVLGETFAMEGVPFAVCYVDDEGDEIIISEDADMRPMFEMARGKEAALRVRLRPP